MDNWLKGGICFYMIASHIFKNHFPPMSKTEKIIFGVLVGAILIVVFLVCIGKIKLLNGI